MFAVRANQSRSASIDSPYSLPSFTEVVRFLQLSSSHLKEGPRFVLFHRQPQANAGAASVHAGRWRPAQPSCFSC